MPTHEEYLLNKEYYDDYTKSQNKKDASKRHYEKYKDTYQKHSHVYYAENKERIRLIAEERKAIVLTHYGGGKCQCVNCGITDIDVLVIDHINDNGAAERRVNHTLGTSFYRWLMVHNFPEGYQTLCANCNLRKEHNRKREVRNEQAKQII